MTANYRDARAPHTQPTFRVPPVRGTVVHFNLADTEARIFIPGLKPDNNAPSSGEICEAARISTVRCCAICGKGFDVLTVFQS